MEQYLRVTMSDGSKYDIPVRIIAYNRASYYAEHDSQFDGSVERSLNEDTLPLFKEDNYEIVDWAANNMNWKNVLSTAIRVQPAIEIDFQEGWINGDKEIVEH